MTARLFAAEYDGVLVVSARDDGESSAVHMDRTWLVARLIAADVVGRESPEAHECAWRTARAWALCFHLGCEYDPATMRAIRHAHAHAHVHAIPSHI